MRILFFTFITALLLSPYCPAQNIEQSVAQSFTLMKKGEWQEAQKNLAKIITVYGPRMAAMNGRKLGVLHYNKGYCELKLAHASDLTNRRKYARLAEASFLACQKYPDNAFYTKSYLYLGYARMKHEDYTGALEVLERFQKTHDPEKDRFNKGAFILHKAICCFKIAASETDSTLGPQKIESR